MIARAALHPGSAARPRRQEMDSPSSRSTPAFLSMLIAG
ncbi:hypothetical protein [Azospirillum endophyticum]